MTNFVDQFRQLVRLLVKWALVCIGVLLCITAVTAAGVTSRQWWAVDRHKAKVEVRAYTGDKQCDDKFPVAVAVLNKSARTIEETDIKLRARRPGHSTDLTKYGNISSDAIIRPGEGFGNCWKIDLSENAANLDPKELEWSVEYFTVRFAE